MKRIHVYLLTGIVILGMVVWAAWPSKKSIAPTSNLNNTNNPGLSNVPTDVDQKIEGSEYIGFSTVDFPDRDSAFNFTAQIPKNWRVEYKASSKAINIYDPTNIGSSSLEQSKIFIKYFKASSFLTLSTVDISSQTDEVINGRLARTYIITKKSGIVNFAGQPSWRNTEHQVTDIRSADENPSIYYVVSKSPLLTKEVFNAFLQSLQFTSAE